MKKIITLFIVTLLGACGGGGGNSSSNSDVKTGQFKDSVVKGLGYSTVTQNGITDENGTFKYQLNEIVTFKIGEMEIGSAQGADILYPTHIVETEADAVKIAQVLQTLDKDGDADNEGIDITGQFNEQQTRNQNIADSADLQALIDEIKTATETITLVNSATAKAHIDATIFADMHPTFESISNQDDIDSRISIDNSRLKLSPQNSDGESVWLLAKSDTEITSLSADVEFDGAYYSGLVLELSDGVNKAEYFRIVITSGDGCPPDADFCAAVVVCTIAVNSLYLGELSASPHTFLGIDLNDRPNYTKTTLDKYKVLHSDYSCNAPPSENFTATFTIELDKTDRKVIVKHGDESGYFDISNLFSDFSQIQAKFFINMYSRAFNNDNKSAYVDNVQLNNQDFDDFSASTLDTNKWKTGKFLYSGE